MDFDDLLVAVKEEFAGENVVVSDGGRDRYIRLGRILSGNRYDRVAEIEVTEEGVFDIEAVAVLTWKRRGWVLPKIKNLINRLDASVEVE